MLTSIIRWSARNVMIVVFVTGFVALLGVYAVLHTPLDAIPDLSDTQVIVYTEFPGQAPQVVEDQVTFPLTTAMIAVPGARAVRGFSFFGTSFVYIIFEDGTDLYWARSRVLEYLSFASGNLPGSVTPTLGPDATGVGWVYEYALTSNKQNLAELRTLQDWYLRYQLAAVGGVSEIASVGGFVQQYQITIDPTRLRSFGFSLQDVRSAIEASNMEVGGRSVELSEREYIVRGSGYVTSLADLAAIPLMASNGTPVSLGDIARIELGPNERRGIAEMGGVGEVAAGIVVQRFGENALGVIDDVKRQLAGLMPSLPDGVSIETVYDRSELILRAIETLRVSLLEESAIVALICFLFLLHARSALVAIVTLPAGILMAFGAMYLLGISSNIMSLGGIAIAIGAMIDTAIVMIENAHKHLERAQPGQPRAEIILKAAAEVGPALFFRLLIVTVSFLPVFSLEAQEGRLFKPLAFTKTFSMAAAAILSVTLVPALMVIFIRGRIVPERKNPINRALIAIYRPIIRGTLRARFLVLVLSVVALAATLIPFRQLGTEFMPNLNEGALLYMPTTLPGISVTQAAQLVQTQNKIISTFPEVLSVFGKAGRAETATDPAPMEMIETVINLKPESEWRSGVSLDDLIVAMDRALQLPGVSNAWTMPIKARIDMLSTGIRTPVGIKILGEDLAEMDQLAREIEAVLKTVPGTTSAYSERVTGSYYMTIEPDRVALARYNLSIADVQSTVAMALGGEAITQVVDGRQRFDVILRYPRELRADPDAIGNMLIHSSDGMSIPLAQVASITLSEGPSSIRTENAQLALYVFVDFRGVDIGSYVEEAQRMVTENVEIPTGYSLVWSGQFEYLERAKARLVIVVPITLLTIFLLLYLYFRRITETLIVMLSLPFAMIGGVWFLALMDFDLSVAVVVGFIALAGVAAETGIVMLLYLDNATKAVLAERAKRGERPTVDDLAAAIEYGSVERVRPKLMTVFAIVAGLVPILWNHGTGSEVMQRIAAPMIGGMISSTVLTLIVIPALYSVVKTRRFGETGIRTS
ncbi:MAG: CusA/CzcA family heavy metal efflux RND transporter [Dongiaceae bacterium]